jgi:hypothetical protein
MCFPGCGLTAFSRRPEPRPSGNLPEGRADGGTSRSRQTDWAVKSTHDTSCTRVARYTRAMGVGPKTKNRFAWVPCELVPRIASSRGWRRSPRDTSPARWRTATKSILTLGLSQPLPFPARARSLHGVGCSVGGGSISSTTTRKPSSWGRTPTTIMAASLPVMPPRRNFDLETVEEGTCPSPHCLGNVRLLAGSVNQEPDKTSRLLFMVRLLLFVETEPLAGFLRAIVRDERQIRFQITGL